MNTDTATHTRPSSTGKTSKRRRTVTAQHKAEFLDRLREGFSVAHAASSAGWDRGTFYKIRQRDPNFAQAWDEAIEAGNDRLEDEARRRAVDGVTEPVFYKGEVIGQVQKYSDTLLMFLLNGRRPERFRQRASVEHSGKDGGPIEHLTLDAIDAEIARLSQLLGASE